MQDKSDRYLASSFRGNRALPYLGVPRLFPDRLSRLSACPSKQPVDEHLVDDRLVHILRLVESLVPLAALWDVRDRLPHGPLDGTGPSGTHVLACHQPCQQLRLPRLFQVLGFITENINMLLAYLGFSAMLPDPIAYPNALLALVGVPEDRLFTKVILPIGISFHTFQSMSYTIDAYNGVIQTERGFVRFLTFVSFFPQLVAGPIERAHNLLPQLQRTPAITRRDISDGLSLFLVGFFKKVAMADYLAQYVDQVYGNPGLFQAPALLLATFAFAWQIYFDFSGYTDMARGIALLMGFRMMLNFNNPYTATGLGDFWNRWHISLSTWFKDYLYFPLGGSRHGKMRTYINIVITMIISGVWHGAAWTFIVWGGLHALGRCLTRELEQTEFYQQRIPRLAKQLAVFSFVTFTWIFFRRRASPTPG